MLLEVKNLKVNLNGEDIIKNLSFKINSGEVMTILGPNGAGKSILLKTLLGFLPYEGEIIWGGEFKIGYLPQGLNQLRVKNFPLTVYDFFKLKDPVPKLKEIVNFLNLVGLDKKILRKTANNLSGGQFQRMLVAWVLVSHPQVIFFDEPMTGIDIGGGDTIYSLLHSIEKKERLSIFLVTHDLNVVYKHSTKVLCLSRRGYNCFGRPKEILDPKTLEEVFGKKIKFYEHR